MENFGDSSWAKEDFSKKYLERADIYIVDRSKMLWMVVSFYFHFFDGRKGISLLDLGCGDGMLTEQILRLDSTASVTLVDGSETMLQKARERLTGFENVCFVQASFHELLRNEVKLSEFDLCLSSQAIHHLDTSEKTSLFRYIYVHLNHGGCFVNIDVVRAASGEVQEWYYAVWRDWMQAMFERFNIDDELPTDIIRRYKDPSSMNRPDTLETQLRTLSETGFTNVDCYYKNGIFTVFGGKKR
ncbi:MAG TPA: methyltransferase domain-containing protein [Thermodesulfovibrionales bacterium]|nr:methyltransferase domain-containing protein [Thermodesulfovibrionales bacterium]